MIERLDHINLRTARLDEMVDWYVRVLDMESGKRPDFGFPGAWMYANGQALVHLVGTDAEPGSDPADLKLEHGAFQARDIKAFIAKLDSLGERYERFKVPGFSVEQVNIWDPDGNHLHVDFHGEG